MGRFVRMPHGTTNMPLFAMAESTKKSIRPAEEAAAHIEAVSSLAPAGHLTFRATSNATFFLTIIALPPRMKRTSVVPLCSGHVLSA